MSAAPFAQGVETHSGIKAGDIVKLRDAVFVGPIPEGREDHPDAVVRVIGSGGELSLNREIGGLSYWNVDDVELVTEGQACPQKM